MWVHVYMCLCESLEINVNCLSNHFFYLIFESNLLMKLQFIDLAKILISEPKGSFYLCLPRAGK